MTYLGPRTDFHLLSHVLISCVPGSIICPSNIFSIEGPLSRTSLMDSESRLSRFSKAITSFRCSCTCKSRKVLCEWEPERERCIQVHHTSTANIRYTLNRKVGIQMGIVILLPVLGSNSLIKQDNQRKNKWDFSWKTLRKFLKESCKNSQVDLDDCDHQQKRESSMQYQDQELEAFPIDDISHSLHSPSVHCNI